MRVGSDALKLPDSLSYPPVEQLQRAADHGLAGLFFRTIQHVSPALDAGELADVRSCADDLGMYLEAGIGKVNPYGLAESPEVRDLGDGDTVLGFRRLMEAAAAIGIRELWAETATIKPYHGRFAYDRFRTDAPWADQLAATEKLLAVLAPIARDLGLHINLETHEEITTFELVRLVEAVGADAIGITFDTANVLQRAEHPVWAAKRIAPYVRQTHIKDAGLFRASDGLDFQVRPCGAGVVDFGAIIPILYAHNADLNLSLEVDGFSSTSRPQTAPPLRRRPAAISLYDEDWIAGHPDLGIEELIAYLDLLQEYETAIADGRADSHDDYERRTRTLDTAWQFVRDSAAHLRQCAESSDIALEGRVEKTA